MKTLDETKAVPAEPTNPPPRHVAIIMDGNGRWAAGRGRPRIEGHRAGAKSVGECVDACAEAGVEFLTLYAFSSENWNRPEHEVDGLMRLLEQFLSEKTDEMVERGVRLRAIGRLHLLPKACRERLERTMQATAENHRLTVILALSYSGRAEITDAVRSIAADAQAGLLSPGDIDEELISSRLYTAGIPDPDLLIRTSGEMRISNFLLWQLSYTEIHVTQKFWPEFRKADLRAALEDYQRRHRRYGRVG